VSDEEQQATVKVPTEIYSRVVGYIRPLDSWGKAKQQEFHDRVTYDVGQTEGEREPDPGE